ncbi:MAG: preprotein translocase subunit SecG [Phycisphaerales bacterium]|nr:preprotein translocase subunit SecG [Phycisphaerales bacterium]
MPPPISLALPSTLAYQIPPFVVGLLVVLFVAVGVILILTVLIQRPQGGGLSGAFGSGAGSGQTAFGAKTGDALTIITIAMFVVWLIFAVGLNLTMRPGAAQPAAIQAPADQPPPSPEGTPATDAPGATQLGTSQPGAEAPSEPAPSQPPAGEPAPDGGLPGSVPE